MSEVFYRACYAIETRKADDGSVEFVAATEQPVQTYFGPEVLRISDRSVNLKRYRSNPVILDTHDRYGIGSIVGRASEVKVDSDRARLLVRVEFAPTERGQEAKALVEGGFLRAVSVGYSVDETMTLSLAEGETKEGLVGPARLVRSWELMEISLVPVPADSAALKRAQKEGPVPDTSIYEQASAPTPTPPAPPVVTAPQLRVLPPVEGETRARELVAIRTAVLAFTPESMRDYAEELLLAEPNLTIESARKLVLKEFASRRAPVGTPEPNMAPAATATQATTEAETRSVISSLFNIRED